MVEVAPKSGPTQAQAWRTPLYLLPLALLAGPAIHPHQIFPSVALPFRCAQPLSKNARHATRLDGHELRDCWANARTSLPGALPGASCESPPPPGRRARLASAGIASTEQACVEAPAHAVPDCRAVRPSRPPPAPNLAPPHSIPRPGAMREHAPGSTPPGRKGGAPAPPRGGGPHLAPVASDLGGAGEAPRPRARRATRSVLCPLSHCELRSSRA